MEITRIHPVEKGLGGLQFIEPPARYARTIVEFKERVLREAIRNVFGPRAMTPDVFRLYAPSFRAVETKVDGGETIHIEHWGKVVSGPYAIPRLDVIGGAK